MDEFPSEAIHDAIEVGVEYDTAEFTEKEKTELKRLLAEAEQEVRDATN